MITHICLSHYKICSLNKLFVHFRETDEYGVASVQRSTIINTSKEMSALSDFLPPAEYPNYMHNSKLLSYLEQYMKHFKLESYIRYKHEVMMVEKNDNYDESGEWKVRIKNSVNICRHMPGLLLSVT